MNCRICGHGYGSEISSQIPVAYRQLCYACHQGIVEGGDKIYVIIFSLLERIEKLEKKPVQVRGASGSLPILEICTCGSNVNCRIHQWSQKFDRCICNTAYAMHLSCPIHKPYPLDDKAH